MEHLHILIIIPARGGSKGIPRKNLRALAGKPLISYAISHAKGLSFSADIVVSSDDDEILSISEQLGAMALKRDPNIAVDSTTLDPVIYAALVQMEQKRKAKYDLVITMQPTSPLLQSSSIDEAVEKMLRDESIDTTISAVNDTHLSWVERDGVVTPNYAERVNRQFLPQVYKETGGFLISRRRAVTESSRIGVNVQLHLLSPAEAIDIDTYEDWNICEYYLSKKRILFVVSGYHEIGLGHVYNTLLIANDILDHDISFLVDSSSSLAFEKIASKNYPVFMQKYDDIVDDIAEQRPHIVINDRLDTSEEYIQAISKLGIRTVNFEDLGSGALKADLVINAIYPEKEILPNHYFGHRYFILRDEFLLCEKSTVSESVRSVLLTFGGVDPNNFTLRVLREILDYCLDHGIEVNVVAGFGYSHYDSLASISSINVFRNVTNISSHMSSADIIFTSAGRTTYEVASLGVPAIVMAQNERELSHFFANPENGFVNLGLGTKVGEGDVLETFRHLVENPDRRRQMAGLMSQSDLRQGRSRTIKLIKDLLEQI